jgi:hypothetical protein
MEILDQNGEQSNPPPRNRIQIVKGWFDAAGKQHEKIGAGQLVRS